MSLGQILWERTCITDLIRWTRHSWAEEEDDDDSLEYWWRCSRCPRAEGKAAGVSESAEDTQVNTTCVCESRVRRLSVSERSSRLKRPYCWNTFGFMLTDTFLSSGDVTVSESVNHSTCTSQRPDGQILRAPERENTNNKHQAQNMCCLSLNLSSSSEIK